jgi:alginate O-acetyltransferase complex protein AlgI
MVFSSAVFLFLFLPLTLALYFLSPRPLRNATLLLASLLFYGWGEVPFLAVLLGSIAFNTAAALAIEKRSDRGRRLLLGFAVAVNLGLLLLFKYVHFIFQTLTPAAPSILGPAYEPFRQITLPLGISFFTFQALTYVVDVYRREVPAQRNPLNVALYIMLFPQLVAGPIVRYGSIAGQLAQRSTTLDGLAEGAARFVVGLGKKLLIANTLALPADTIFALPEGRLLPGVAWIGLACYTFQIYFDFSGYSDMAIGLGRMMGFTFPENFAHPYASRSITEFWRRWHMSLSTFFRDYLYIPMGGNRGPAPRVMLNLLLVFFLCGLWHGASWTFVIWGLYHGAFLVVERAFRGARESAAPVLLRHGYVLLVAAVGWVFFRCETLDHALRYLSSMAGLAPIDGASVPLVVDGEVWLVLAVAAVFSMPVLPWLKRRQLPAVVPVGGLALVLFACALKIAAGTYNPFIYFRF